MCEEPEKEMEEFKKLCGYNGTKRLVKKNQSPYRPGVARRVPGS